MKITLIKLYEHILRSQRYQFASVRTQYLPLQADFIQFNLNLRSVDSSISFGETVKTGLNCIAISVHHKSGPYI